MRIASRSFEPGEPAALPDGGAQCRWSVIGLKPESVTLEIRRGADAEKTYGEVKARPGAQVLPQLVGKPVWLPESREYVFLQGDTLGTLKMDAQVVSQGAYKLWGEQLVKLVAPRLGS